MDSSMENLEQKNPRRLTDLLREIADQESGELALKLREIANNLQIEMDQKPSLQSVEHKRAEWVEKRRKVIKRIRQIADIMENWSVGGNIANIAGSSIGIIGGCCILGGLAFPPLLVPGIVVSLVGAGGNIGACVARMAVVKNLADEAQTLFEEDARLLNAFVDEAETYIQFGAGVGNATSATVAAIRALVPALRNTFITVPNAVGGTTLKALLPAAAVGPIRVAAGVTAGIGMAIDIVSIISAATSLASNERDELATKLKEIAEKLEEELGKAEPAQETSENKEQ